MSHLLETVKSATEEGKSYVPHLHEASNIEDIYPVHSEAAEIRSHDYQELHNNHSSVVVPEYDEHEVTVVDWFRTIFANPVEKIVTYLVSLFPIAQWILHYNFKWLTGDLIAGITVGVVLVPQSMSYAQLAGLEAQYGLYSSFVGVFIYSFFATSKDVSIGPVAVMSLQVSKVIAHVQAHAGDKYSAPEIATFLSLICGGIAAGIGILRLGFILEFISIPAVMGFMTGSAFSIITGQVPGLMGYNSKVNTRNASYQVVIDTLKHLPDTTVDAAFGLVPLFILYLWKWLTEKGQTRWPKYKVWFFYTQQLRNAIVIIVCTAISWGIVHPKKKAFEGPGKFKPPISTIGDVPSGLKHVGVMHIPDGIIGDMAAELPVSVVILLLEHIAIAKSFGRINDYKVNPNQEVIAIGVNNLIGTFFNAYPATGSFSRSALKAKCGVRTPLAGIFTGAVVLLALYALTSSFYYIPKATLCAVIIHAVSDLMANYKVTFSFWNIAPIDGGIFLICVIITVFSSIEAGVYFAVAASLVVYLVRVAFARGQFLGRVQIAEVVNPVIERTHTDESGSDSSSADVEIHQVLTGTNYNATDKLKVKSDFTTQPLQSAKQLVANNPNIKFHTRWVPLPDPDHPYRHSVNDQLQVAPPPDGVIVFRPGDAFTYPNSSRQVDRVTDEIKRVTRPGQAINYNDTGSRPWNDPGPLRWRLPWKKNKDTLKDGEVAAEDIRPVLRIVHFDFSIVAQTDVTSIQALVDLQKIANRYADREVEFHFSGIHSPWIRRALLNAGFGTYGENLVSEYTYVNIAANDDLENAGGYYAAVSTNTPFFHLDIPNYASL
ncbi:sulfate permease 2 [Diutina catenulata]